MVEDMATKAALGDEESQLLVTEEEMKELHRQVSQIRFLFTNCNIAAENDARAYARNIIGAAIRQLGKSKNEKD